MDIDTIIGLIITIFVLGYGLYKIYRTNIDAHKTTQGKIDAVITTTENHQKSIDQAIADIEQVIADIRDKNQPTNASESKEKK
jgi:hypothetical protein